MPPTLSSLQLARLVQIYLAEPGASLDEKAALVGIGRNALLRATHGTISRTVRLRLLAHFAPVRPQLAPARQARTPRRQELRKRGVG
jgi:hypothetical protein